VISRLRALISSLSVCKRLLIDYGFYRSVQRGVLTDRDGYIPWFTYPAIEALKTWELSDKVVLEYGSGYSTLFWATRCRSVISIEHDKAWFEKIGELMPANVDLRLRPLEIYAEVDGAFDVIVIDGYAEKRMRYNCARASLPHLNKGGLVIVDNSDWLPATCFWLRQAGLIQVDFSGLVPGNANTQTTSFFFMQEFNFKHHQTLSPIGGTGYNWEPALEQELLSSAPALRGHSGCVQK